MGSFVSAVLERNEAGATYEGTVFDRFLEARLADGRLLEIFDQPPPLSTTLPPDKRYEFILVVALPSSVEIGATNVSMLRSDQWQGTVVDPHCKPQGIGYERYRPELLERLWVLLSTEYGQLLMNPDELSTPVSAGSVIRWQDARFDLYAIGGGGQ